MTREEIIAFFDRRQEHWRRHDAAALAADYAPDALVQSPTGGLLKGQEAVEPVHRLWFTAFPDLDVRHEELLVDGDRAALLITVTGTHTGEFFGLAATGRRIEVPGVFLYTVRDGRIVAEQRILDFTGVLVKVGVLRARPA